MAKKSGYGQFCPVAKAAEIVAERWTLLVLRELILGSRRFNELRRGVPLMSPTLLSQRLRELEDSGVVERKSGTDERSVEYHLTQAGQELGPIIMSLGQWGRRWVRSRLKAQDYDPALLMWDIRRRIDSGRLPVSSRTVVEFNLEGSARQLRRWWLVCEKGEIDLCLKDPGYPVQLQVLGDVRTLADVWLGYLSMDQAIASRKLLFEGPRQLASDFRKSLKLSSLVTGAAKA